LDNGDIFCIQPHWALGLRVVRLRRSANGACTTRRVFRISGSPQSREGDERREAKLDAILCSIDKQTGDEVIAELDRKYPKR
jgi:hypothetical protein